MDRTNVRTYTKITDDTKRYLYHDHPYSGLKKEINHFKNHHPYDDHSYSKFRYQRSSISGNQKSLKPRSTECRSDKHDLASYGSFEHRLVKERTPDYAAAGQRSSDYRSAEYRVSEHRKTEHITLDIHSSAKDRTTDQKSAKFPSQDDIAKCCLMKVNKVIEPQLKKLLRCIFEDKQHSETLELYARKQGLDSKWRKHFSEEQIKNICQYPDFEGFDSTLIFRCIEVLREFNPSLIMDEKLKLYIDDTMKTFKSIRNMLSHNRKNLTDKQCHDIANSLKQPLEDLLKIIHMWKQDMNIATEKMKIWEEVQTVMDGGLTESEFRYMCLLQVIKCNVESVLHKITKLICYDKEKKENFREYFKRKGMNNKTYKDTFFKEEKDILESYSEKVQPDLTLYCKIIEACKNWHPSLKDNETFQNDLSNILRKIRVIRNYAIHNMLSMTSNECKVKAQELGHSLKDLVDLVNIIQNKKSDMTMDAAKININQVYFDISSTMSVPYTML